MNDAETLRVLEIGLDRIRLGWIPGLMYDQHGGYCAIGAVVMGMPTEWTGVHNYRPITELYAAIDLNRVPDDPYNKRSRWSLIHGGSKANVVAAVSNSGQEAAIKMFQAAIRNVKARMAEEDPVTVPDEPLVVW